MSEATLTRIFRKNAQDLMAWVGWKKTGNWPNDKIAGKLSQIPTTKPDEDPEDATVADTLLKVEAALEAGGEFEVYGDEGQSIEEYQAALDASGDEDDDAAADEEEETVSEETTTEVAEETVEAPAKKTKTAKPSKEQKEEVAEKKEKKPKRQFTRNHCAGAVLKKNGGFKSGMQITDEMVAQVNEMFGAANDSTSKGALHNALQVLEGYQGE